MRIIKYILGIVIFAIVSSLIVLYANDKINQNVVVTEYTFVDRKIPEGFWNSKIMMISDLHNADFSEQIIEHIKTEKPDYVVMTGDMVQLPGHEIDNTLKIVEEVVSMEI